MGVKSVSSTWSSARFLLTTSSFSSELCRKPLLSVSESPDSWSEELRSGGLSARTGRGKEAGGSDGQAKENLFEGGNSTTTASWPSLSPSAWRTLGSRTAGSLDMSSRYPHLGRDGEERTAGRLEWRRVR